MKTAKAILIVGLVVAAIMFGENILNRKCPYCGGELRKTEATNVMGEPLTVYDCLSCRKSFTE